MQAASLLLNNYVMPTYTTIKRTACWTVTAITKLAISIFNYIRNIFYPTPPPAAPPKNIALQSFHEIIQQDPTSNAITLTLPLAKEVMEDLTDEEDIQLFQLIAQRLNLSKEDFLRPCILEEFKGSKKSGGTDELIAEQDKDYYQNQVADQTNFACRDKPKKGKGIGNIKLIEKWNKYDKLYQERKVVIKWSDDEDFNTALSKITHDVQKQVLKILAEFKDYNLELNPSLDGKSLNDMTTRIAWQNPNSY